MEPTPKGALNSLTELGKKIEGLFVQQVEKIAFHQNDAENDYRVQVESLSTRMFDKSISDEKHLEYARAIITQAEAYKENFIVPLQRLNVVIRQELDNFEEVLRTVQKQPIDELLTAVERWLSLSKKLHQARVMAADSIVNRTEFEKRIPSIIIKNNGHADITLPEEEKKQFVEGLATYSSLWNASCEHNQRIQQEREPLARQLFFIDDEAKAVGPPPATTRRPATAVHPLEGKAWFRLMKVVYIGSWILGLGISAILAHGAGEPFIFVAGAVILSIVLIVLKKGFYYIVLGRTTANEKPGKGFVDLEDLRNDLAAVRANSPDLYQEVVAPFFETWKAQYGRRVPLAAVDTLQQRIADEMNSLKEKKQQIISKAANKGATIELASIRKNLEKSFAEYEGADRQQYIRHIERLLLPLETKYGTAIPVDEASKILDTIEDDIRANEKAHGEP